MRLCIHVGKAFSQFAGGVAARNQRAQCLGFGTIPGILRETPARGQSPVALDFVALQGSIGIGRFGNVARKVDGDGAYQGSLTRINADHDGRALVEIALACDADVGAEVAQRAHELAHIVLGQHDQAGQLGVVKIGHRAVALQFDVLFE